MDVEIIKTNRYLCLAVLMLCMFIFSLTVGAVNDNENHFKNGTFEYADIIEMCTIVDVDGIQNAQLTIEIYIDISALHE